MIVEDTRYLSFALLWFNKVGRYALNTIQIQNEFLQQVRIALCLGDELCRNNTISCGKITK